MALGWHFGTGQFRSPHFIRRMSFRVVAISTMLVAFALFVVSLIISNLYRDAIERRFDALLSAHLFSLVASTSVTAGNQLVGLPQIGEQRYQQPDTGWVWDVVPVNATVTGKLASSFATEVLNAPPLSNVPFDDVFQRRYNTNDANGQTLRVLETEVQLGSETTIARFRVAGNLKEVDDEANGFFRQIVSFLGIVGLMMIAINASAIVYGLKPLGRARHELGRVRSGEASLLTGRFPYEIEPLANEINALIENNRRIVDRSRVQVGDLAHALKTPLAVVTNEANTVKTPAGQTISEQAGLMRQQIEHYLQRARFAAQIGTVAYRTEAAPVLERLLRAFKKLSPDKRFEFSPAPIRLWFAGEQQDLEEIIGNLFENAAKWAKQIVYVSIGVLESSPAGPQQLMIVIEDDGPGIPLEKHSEALRRGRRLDETKPGTGLGLAIVAQLVGEYHGQLNLGQSSLGGLKVTVALPIAQQ